MAILTAFGTTRIDQVTVALDDQAYRDSILPAELVGQPLADPLVLDAIERWASAEAAEVLGSLFVVAAHRARRRRGAGLAHARGPRPRPVADRDQLGDVAGREARRWLLTSYSLSYRGRRVRARSSAARWRSAPGKRLRRHALTLGPGPLARGHHPRRPACPATPGGPARYPGRAHQRPHRARPGGSSSHRRYRATTATTAPSGPRQRRGFRVAALQVTREPTDAAAAAMAERLKAEVPRLVDEPWLVLEDKGPALTFHFRAAPDIDAARSRVIAAVDAVDPEGLLCRAGGRRAHELRPVGATTKGITLRRLIEEHRPATMLMLGDDRHDALPSTRCVRLGLPGAHRGLAIAVAGHADVTVRWRPTPTWCCPVRKRWLVSCADWRATSCATSPCRRRTGPSGGVSARAGRARWRPPRSTRGWRR